MLAAFPLGDPISNSSGGDTRGQRLQGFPTRTKLKPTTCMLCPSFCPHHATLFKYLIEVPIEDSSGWVLGHRMGKTANGLAFWSLLSSWGSEEDNKTSKTP